jgi:hypothetical protein
MLVYLRVQRVSLPEGKFVEFLPLAIHGSPLGSSDLSGFETQNGVDRLIA